MLEFLRLLFGYAFGGAFVVGILGFMYKRHAEEWEVLASVYGRKWAPPIQKKRFRSLVLYREGKPARPYAGIVTLGVYEHGIALKPFVFLAPFHKPVFIPFADIQGWKQSWYWDGASTELMFTGTPELQMIMPEVQVKWISSVGQSGIAVSDDYVPRSNWPWATQAMAVCSLCMVIAVIGLSILQHTHPGILAR